MAIVVVVCAGAALFTGLGMFLAGSERAMSSDRQALLEKVQALEEELSGKQLAMSAGEGGAAEEAATPALAETPTPGFEETAGAAGQEPPRQGEFGGESPFTSNQEPPPESDPFGTPVSAEAPQPAEPTAPAGEQQASARIEDPFASGATQPPAEPATMITFDAEDVTAIAEGPNEGKVIFKLVKDNPQVRFTGYLFVIVEMVDEQGEQKIYSYPSRARLGEAFLPKNFTEGETLSFKYNSKVELPYRDKRAGARLSTVSIVLYREDGRIVYQRGFDRGDLKIIRANATNVNGTPQPPSTRRRAL